MAHFSSKMFSFVLRPLMKRPKLLNCDSLCFVVRKRGFHQVTGDVICPSQVMGIDHLRDPRLNKGLAFTLEERQMLGIHGLHPAVVKTQEEQLELCKLSVMSYEQDLNKYLYLTELHDRNERLFFRLLSENVKMLLPVVYTPTVGLACQKFGLIYRRPRGLFISLSDRGHCYDVLKNWAEPDVRAIVVTDGERILGLGDLGAAGMGIPVGKLALCTALGGIKPWQCLPITLDVGTNTDALLEDPLYIGLRQKRCGGPEYDDFVDEFMHAVVKRYGPETLIQFEDFGNSNAFRFLDKYRNTFCVFNDDIQGTASVVVAGIFSSARITGMKISDHKFLFLGAGEASTGIANLIVAAMKAEGTGGSEARSKIYMYDIDGLLTNNRKLADHQIPYGKDHADTTDFAAGVSEFKPTALIGASTKGGAFTPEILKTMANNNERPLIFALSNPTSKSECTAAEAYTHTEGKAIFASGSPFDEVQFDGKTFVPGQGNNAYVFPGIALGVVIARLRHVSHLIFLEASKTLADMVQEHELERGCLYPPHKEIYRCSIAIATQIVDYAFEKGTANLYPKPDDTKKYIKSQLYNYYYTPSLPSHYEWPDLPHIPTKSLEEILERRKKGLM